MDEATRRHWEQIADRCFDRAYLAVLRQVTPKPANGQVPGPRATGRRSLESKTKQGKLDGK